MIALVTGLHLFTLTLFGPALAAAVITGIVWAPTLRKRSQAQAGHDGLAIAPASTEPARALEGAADDVPAIAPTHAQ